MGGQTIGAETAVGGQALGFDRRLGRGTPRGLLRLRSDAALAERYAAGDQTAFSVLYERHRRVVFAVCLGVLGSREDAEDAVQETFVSLAATLRGVAPREFRAWLARVARNAAIDVRRRRRDRTSLEGRVVEIAAPLRGGQEEMESVLNGIRELPEPQRMALVMRELAGYSYREIGLLLAVEEEAVRGLIARARSGLRNHREAIELPCSAARDALATEPDGRRLEVVARRHLRQCAACRASRDALRSDARALRAIAALPTGGLAGGGALAGLGAKVALAGGAMSQAGAVCAVSVCAVGGTLILNDDVTRPIHAAPRHSIATTRSHVTTLHRPTASPTATPATSGRASRGVTQVGVSSTALHSSITGAAGQAARPGDRVSRELARTGRGSETASRPRDASRPWTDRGSASEWAPRSPSDGQAQPPASGQPTAGLRSASAGRGGMQSGRDVPGPDSHSAPNDAGAPITSGLPSTSGS